MKVFVEDGAAESEYEIDLPLSKGASRHEILTSLARYWKRKPEDVIADDEGDDADGRIIMCRGTVHVTIS